MQEREKEFPTYQGRREPLERKDEDILDVLREQIPDETELQRETEEKKEKVRKELHGEAAGEATKKKETLFARIEEVFNNNRIPENTRLNGISNLTEALIKLPLTKEETERLYERLTSYRYISVAYELETTDRYADLIDKVGGMIGKEPMDVYTWKRLTLKNAREYGEKMAGVILAAKTSNELSNIIDELGGISRIGRLYTAKGSSRLIEIVEKRAEEVGLKIGGENVQPSSEKKDKKPWWKRLLGD